MESLTEFWAVVVDVWQTGVLGVDLGRIIVAVAIVLVFLAIRGLFARVVMGFVRRRAEESEAGVDGRTVAALEGPMRFLPLVLGLFFAKEYLELEGTPEAFADGLVRSLVAFTIFWGFYALVDPLSHLMGKLERIFTSAMVNWLVKAIKVAVVLIGAATVLEIWGIEIGPILAGFGLFGVAVALGAQDLFKNLIAGLLILAEKRFQIGDWVKVEGVVEGMVETIGFRSTMIRRFDKAPVYVPNAQLSDTAVTNFSEMTSRRIFWKIGIEYRTGVDQLRQIRDAIEAYILHAPEFEQPPRVPTFVRIDAFGPSSIDIMVYCFTRSIVWGEWLEAKERLAIRIKEIVMESGARFALPAQSVYIETMPGEAPEIFVPPGETAAAEGETKA